jgi:hypothetical protein
MIRPATRGKEKMPAKTQSTKSKKQRIQEAASLLKEFADADWKEKDGGLYATVGTTQVGIDYINPKGVRLFVKRPGDHRFKAVATFH